MNTRFRPVSLPYAVTVALLAGTVLLSALTARRISESLVIPLDQIDSHIAGWAAFQENKLPAGIVKQLDPTSYLSRMYRKGPRELDLFVAFYAQQRAGESMHSPKHCLPGSGWEIWKHDSAMVPVNGSHIRVNKYSIENSGTRMLMFYWYQSKGRIVANEYLGKILLARDTLLTGHTAGSIVRITLPDVPGASEDGVAFAAGLIPQVQRCFGGEDRLDGE